MRSTPDGKGSPEDREGEFDAAAFDAAFAETFGAAVEPECLSGGVGDETAESARARAQAAAEVAPRRVVAVVLTPIGSAPALAGLCAIAGLDADIVPAKSGALAVRVIETAADDPSEVLGGAPAQATELAAALSRTAKAGVVLLTARLGQGDEGLTGTITGTSFINGAVGEDVSAGLILARADDVAEQILFGMLAPADAPGRMSPQEISRWQAAKMLGKAVRKKRR